MEIGKVIRIIEVEPEPFRLPATAPVEPSPRPEEVPV
jgi:hypothetical protein